MKYNIFFSRIYCKGCRTIQFHSVKEGIVSFELGIVPTLAGNGVIICFIPNVQGSSFHAVLVYPIWTVCKQSGSLNALFGEIECNSCHGNLILWPVIVIQLQYARRQHGPRKSIDDIFAVVRYVGYCQMWIPFCQFIFNGFTGYLFVCYQNRAITQWNGFPLINDCVKQSSLLINAGFYSGSR